jgi:hypothetical protein
MFKTISLNVEKDHCDSSQKFRSQYELGKKEWQQNYITTMKDHYIPKGVTL